MEFFPEAEKAEVTVFIGDRREWGKGYGTESVRLVLAELCTEKRVGRVEVDVPKGNDRALGFWHRLGFREYATACHEPMAHPETMEMGRGLSYSLLLSDALRRCEVVVSVVPRARATA